MDIPNDPSRRIAARFLPERASDERWLTSISDDGKTVTSRGDFHRFELRKIDLPGWDKSPGLPKNLFCPLRVSIWNQHHFGDRDGEAVGVFSDGASITAYSVCPRWGFSARSSRRGEEIDLVFHRKQAGVMVRFATEFSGVLARQSGEELVLEGRCKWGFGKLAVRSMPGVSFDPSSTIRRGDFFASASEESVSALHSGSRLSVRAKRSVRDPGWVKLDGEVLEDSGNVEEFERLVPGKLLVAAHGCSGRGGVTISYSASCDPVAASWLAAGDVDSVFVF